MVQEIIPAQNSTRKEPMLVKEETHTKPDLVSEQETHVDTVSTGSSSLGMINTVSPVVIEVTKKPCKKVVRSTTTTRPCVATTKKSFTTQKSLTTKKVRWVVPNSQ